MARILLIDTSTKQCSVAVAQDGRALAWREERTEGYVHAERLMPLIEEVLNDVAWEHQSLQAIAVTGGPGSFTGLRIGVATAKGLCQGWNLPLIALDSKALLAAQGKRMDPTPQPRIGMIDARRMEVYAATYSDDGICLQEVEPVEVDQAPDHWTGPGQFIGDGAVKCKELLAGADRTFEDAWPLARDGAQMAEHAFTEGQFEDLGSYEPKYVKAFKAGAPKDPLGLRSSLKMWWFAWVFMLFSCASCGEQSQFIPYVPVNFQIDLNLPAYNTLNFPGEAIALPGGSKGLYIYRFTLDEFVVLDRHATFDIPLGCQVTLEADNVTLRDDSDCSESEWLMLDGTVMNGPATLPLHRYRTSLNGSILNIFN